MQNCFLTFTSPSIASLSNKNMLESVKTYSINKQVSLFYTTTIASKIASLKRIESLGCFRECI